MALSYRPAEGPDVERISAIIPDCGQMVAPLPGDFSEAHQERELVADAVEQLGGLNIIVNNAGQQIAIEQLENLSDEQFQETFKTNIFDMFWIIKAAGPHPASGSTIINTTSNQACRPSATLVDYASATAAINNFSKGLPNNWHPGAST